jgi:hypothetical protein
MKNWVALITALSLLSARQACKVCTFEMFRGVQEKLAPARTANFEKAVKGGPFGQTRTGLIASV